MSEEDEAAPEPVALGNRVLGVVEDVIYVSVAVLLSVSAGVVLYRAVIELYRAAQLDQSQAMINVLDELLLVFIFVELLYAVRTILHERHVVLEPFLITGILAAIKEIIALSVKGANDYIGKGPEFARAMTEIGLLTGVVIALTVTSVLLRRDPRPVDGPDESPP